MIEGGGSARKKCRREVPEATRRLCFYEYEMLALR